MCTGLQSPRPGAQPRLGSHVPRERVFFPNVCVSVICPQPPPPKCKILVGLGHYVPSVQLEGLLHSGDSVSVCVYPTPQVSNPAGCSPTPEEASVGC